MNVKKSVLIASLLAVTLVACAPAYAAKRDQPVTAPNITVTTTTDSCEPLPNPFPIPVPKAPISEPWPGLSTMTKMFPMLRFLTRSIQTAPSC